MKITTTPNRVVQSGFMCYEAIESAKKIQKELNIDGDTEVDMQEVLRILGVSDTLMSLGSPRARYLKQAEKVLRQFILVLVLLTEEAANKRLRLSKPIKFTLELKNYLDPSRVNTVNALRRKWTQWKSRTEDVEFQVICSIILILLGAFPLKIKAAHIHQKIKELPEYREIEPELYEQLMGLLNADA